MTTNTTMLAINLAEILLGCVERRRAGPIGDLNANHTQSRREFAVLLRLGLGFLVGTALGALAYITVGLLCILLAILPVGSMAAWYMLRWQGQVTVPSSAAIPNRGTEPRLCRLLNPAPDQRGSTNSTGRSIHRLGERVA
jgi:hypothetical protein